MHKNITISDSDWEDLKRAASRMNTTATELAARMIKDGVYDHLDYMVSDYEAEHYDEDEDGGCENCTSKTCYYSPHYEGKA